MVTQSEIQHRTIKQPHQLQQKVLPQNTKLQRDTVFGLVAWKMQRSKAIQEFLDNISFTDTESCASTSATPIAARQDAANNRPASGRAAANHRQASGLPRPLSQSSLLSNERPMMTETNFLRNFKKDDMVLAMKDAADKGGRGVGRGGRRAPKTSCATQEGLRTIPRRIKRIR